MLDTNMVIEPLRPRLTQFLDGPRTDPDITRPHVVGVLHGEGVGPEVVPVALRLLAMLERHSKRQFEIRTGGAIGYPAKAICGSSLSPEVTGFAGEIFRDRGALFCGPGGERFVYELRREFGLYCKFTPIEPLVELTDSGVVRERALAQADMIAVRENLGGIYQGNWDLVRSHAGAIASHSFTYAEADVRRILQVATALAASRRNKMTIVLKPGGIPSISALWRQCAEEISRDLNVELSELEIDNAVYQLIANPGQFDVIVSPNMFGDVLADCASLLLASRGLSYSGNFDDRGKGVYQTGHGAARDIAGKDVANPIGQVLALGMMLRESFDWPEADRELRQAIRGVLQEGKRTSDVATRHCKVVGTAEFGESLAKQLERQLVGKTL